VITDFKSTTTSPRRILFQAQNYGKAMQLPSLTNQYRCKPKVPINKEKESLVKDMKRKQSIAALKNIKDHYTITHGYYEPETIKQS
jgi:hypothetical protein